ncbi:MAG: methionine adenosyltransferase [Chloroflexi bacterium]|nr:methionine adenosyltransferase [Chloroflexota bacterium]
MATSFQISPSLLLTSESVTEGHPDKLCDQISDAVLDAILARDPDARVACEAAATTGFVLVFGEITTQAAVDVQAIVRRTVREVGYDRSSLGFDGETCGVLNAIKEQSADIALGVEHALEARGHGEGSDPLDRLGAGDQGMMVGFACDETPEYMPLTITLAHALVRRLAELRRSRALPYLRPDGKSQVTVEYRAGVPRRIDTVVISTQHEPDVDASDLGRDVEREVIRAVCPEELLDVERPTRILVNPTGRFVTGGPMGDAGLTGRKIIVDTYGGIARHGGGAFSGKDPSKVDRSAAYAARYIAKNLVAAGLAGRLEVQLSYGIGVARPTSVSVESFGTSRLGHEALARLVREHFDLRPAAIIETLGLRQTRYRPLAAYGHFGRDAAEAPWERLDRVDELRAAVE